MHKSILRFASFCTLRNLANSGETVAFSSTISPKLTVVSFRPFAHLAILKENVLALSNERDASSFFLLLWPRQIQSKAHTIRRRSLRHWCGCAWLPPPFETLLLTALLQAKAGLTFTLEN